MTAYFTIDDLSFKRFLTWSIILHVSLTAAILVSMWLQRSGENWGGIGGGTDTGVRVNLVASSGIPMMQPTNATESEAVDPTKGLHKEEPKPKEPEPKTDATKIQKFDKERRLPPSNKSKVFERKTPDVDNAVNYGKGGSMRVPSGLDNTPGPLNGGGISASGPGGDFAGRYPWYVQAIRRAVGQYWAQNQMTIDPAVRSARRARTTLVFTINRDGSVKNIRVAESSGNRSMDDAAQRSLLSVDHFSPLPNDYSGSYVNVSFEFGFDLPL